MAGSSLEHMSRNVTQLYKRKLSPNATDIANLQNDLPTDFTSTYDIVQTLTAGGPPTQTTVGNGCAFLANSHVGHDCRVGNSVILSNRLAEAGMS